jgi:hypothetical protein
MALSEQIRTNQLAGADQRQSGLSDGTQINGAGYHHFFPVTGVLQVVQVQS